MRNEYSDMDASMATLRPNWFLISPVLTASGQCSSMTWKRSGLGQESAVCWLETEVLHLRLIPILAD